MKTFFTIFGLVVVLVIAALLGYFIASEKPTQDAMIRIDSPKSGAHISSPLKVTGQARGNWFFEASFPVVLTDASGNVLAQVPAQAKGDWMTTEFVPFEATLTFSKQVAGSRGVLILKKDNPSGLPANDDSRTVQVYFK
jgi:hypothetical protein